MATIEVRIQKIVQEAIDVKSFYLESLDGSALPPFTAGSHIDVHLANNIVRQYSLCGDETDRSVYMIGVKCEVNSRGGSQGMHDNLSVGETLLISPPRNNFALDSTAMQHLLVAGGIGITPLLGMVRCLAARAMPFRLHYFSRGLEYTAFHAFLQDPRLAACVDFYHALDAVEVEMVLRRILGNQPSSTHIYTCGPMPFMDLVVSRARAAAWPDEAVHLEYFSKNVDDPDVDTKPFFVKLAKSGDTYAVDKHESIVSALATHGIFIDTSCEQGVCGTCIVDVIEGIPDHRDEILDKAEKLSCKKIVPCVSRSKTKILVLDL